MHSEDLFSLIGLAQQYGLTHLLRLCEGYLCRNVQALSQEYYRGEIYATVGDRGQNGNRDCDNDWGGEGRMGEGELHTARSNTSGNIVGGDMKAQVGMEERVTSVTFEVEDVVDPVVELLQYAVLYDLPLLKAVCWATVLRNWNRGYSPTESGLSLHDLDNYRSTHRHAYMVDHTEENAQEVEGIVPEEGVGVLGGVQWGMGSWLAENGLDERGRRMIRKR